MSKRAEEAQASAILPESIISYAKEHAVLSGLVYREGVKYGYERAEKDYVELAQLWVGSGNVNIMGFKQFLKCHETQSNK